MRSAERQLLDCIETPIFVLERTADGTVRYVGFNSTACRILGVTSDQIIGKTAKEVYGGRLGELLYERHCQVAASGKAWTYEYDIRIGEGFRRIRTTLRPWHAPGGRFRLVGTSEDITVEHGVRQVQAASGAISEDIERFISLAAHDLRAPMRKVQSLVSMLREDIEDPSDDIIETMDMLDSVADGARILIGDLVSYAQATGITEKTGEFDLAPLCREILAMLDPMKRHTAQITDASLYGDRIATQIVIRNLMDNAFKNNEDKSVTLAISAQSGPEGSYEISVTDDGTGFDDPGLLFLDGGTLRVDSGYGLFGVRRLISTRGGSISAGTAASGQGACIRFTLPGRLINAERELEVQAHEIV